MIAAEVGNKEIIRLLLDKGLGINAKDIYGKSAYQYASNPEITKELEQVRSPVDNGCDISVDNLTLAPFPCYQAVLRKTLYREKFELNRKVDPKTGSGGKIQMAKYLPTGAYVAIKFHRTKEARDRTAEILSSLDPRVIAGLAQIPDEDRLFDDTDKYPDYPYCLVMDGGQQDLQTVLDEEGALGLPENEVRFIFDSICRSVLHLHNKGICHHDIKPKNLVKFYNGEPLGDARRRRTLAAPACFGGCITPLPLHKQAPGASRLARMARPPGCSSGRSRA